MGNSSSGIIEVPSFGIPTLNIGDRQKGRVAALSVYNYGTSKEEIREGLQVVLSLQAKIKAQHCKNPYEGKDTTNDILKVIKTYPLENIIHKSFYNI